MMQSFADLTKNFFSTYQGNPQVTRGMWQKMQDHFQSNQETFKNIRQSALKGNYTNAQKLYQDYLSSQAEMMKDMYHHTTKQMKDRLSSIQGTAKEAIAPKTDDDKPSLFSNLLKINKFNLAILGSLMAYGMPSQAKMPDSLSDVQATHSSAIVPFNKPLESLDPAQLKSFISYAEDLSSNTKAASKFTKLAQEAQKIMDEATKAGSKNATPPQLTQEQQLAYEFVKSLGKNVTVDLVKETFGTISTKLKAIWQKQEQEALEDAETIMSKQQKFVSQATDITKKLAKSYVVLQWNIMKVSWKIGMNMLIDLGPTLFKAFSRELMQMLSDLNQAPAPGSASGRR